LEVNMAPAPNAQFRLHQELGAIPQIERHLAELLKRLPQASGEIEDNEDIKETCIFLCRGVHNDDLSLVDRHMWVRHFKRIGLTRCSQIAKLTGDVSSKTDHIQQKFEVAKIKNPPSRAATRMIVVAACSAVHALEAEAGKRP
jgi:hypothetical protein